jgi:hypothetical protein
MLPRWWRPPIPSAEVVRLAERLRARRPLSKAVVACSALASLCIPIAMHLLQFQLQPQPAWAGVAVIAQIRAETGLAWWMLAWVFPLVYPIAVFALIWSFEAAAVVLDPRDASSAALRWSLRGPVALLAVTFASALLLASGMALVTALTSEGGKAAVLAASPLLLLPFFIWNVELVSSEAPRLANLRPRWPGIRVVLLAFAAVCFLGLLAVYAGAEVEGLLWPLVFLVMLAVQLSWLRRGDSVRSTLVSALSPRVFLPMFVFHVRAFALVALLLLPIVPLALFLLYLAPMLEDQLVAAPLGTASWLVSSSRFAVSWWWALVMVVLGIAQWIWTIWVWTAGSARVLERLGLVPGPAVPGS